MAELVRMHRRSLVEVWWNGLGYHRRWVEIGETVMLVNGPLCKTRVFSEREWFALFPPPWDAE